MREASIFDNSALFFLPLESALKTNVTQWSGHIQETWCVGEWGCVVVQKIRALLQLPPITEKSVSSLN